MNHWQRNSAYITGAIVIGLLLIIISNGYIQFVAQEGLTGYLVLIAFGLVYLNLGFVISRRFVIKARNADFLCYLMSLLIVIPTLFWIFTKDTGLGAANIYFAFTVLFSPLLGAYFGIRRGKVKRAEYIQQLREEERELPDQLKRPHDDLKKN